MRSNEAAKVLEQIEAGGAAYVPGGVEIVRAADDSAFVWTVNGNTEELGRGAANKRLREYKADVIEGITYRSATDLVAEDLAAEIGPEGITLRVTEAGKAQIEQLQAEAEQRAKDGPFAGMTEEEIDQKMADDIAVEETIEAELAGESDGFPQEQPQEETQEMEQSTLEFAAKSKLDKGEISRESYAEVLDRKITLDEAVRRVQSGEEQGAQPRKAEANADRRRRVSKGGKLAIGMSRDEAFGKARQAIEAGDEGFRRYNTWAVEIDGEMVAPKWLVSLLTGVKPSEFATPAARTALMAIGIEPVKIEKQ